MSRTRKPEGLIRPAKKYIKYHGGRDPEDPGKFEGTFTYYDKEEGDVEIDLTEPFIILDGCTFGSQLFSVTGWCEAYKVYAWSNEVRSTEDEIVVRLFDKKKTVLLKGPYSEIKQEVKDYGLKFTRCVYLVFEGSEEINHLSLSGGAFRQWAEAIESEPDKIASNYVHFVESEKGKKGTVKFWNPVFKFGDEISDEHGELADKADKRLQEYLDKYFKKDPKETPVYDRENTDTDSWAFIPLESYDSDDDRELGQLDLDDLNKIREDLEEKGEEDGTFYQFVCRACKEKREEQKKEETKEKTTEEKPKKKFNDIFKKKDKKEETDQSWKKAKLPEGIGIDAKFLGELDHEDITELKEVMDKNEDAQEAYPELYEAVKIAAKLPF